MASDEIEMASERVDAFDEWWDACGGDEDLERLQVKVMAECGAICDEAEAKVMWQCIKHLCRAAYMAGGISALGSIIDECGLLSGGPGTEN